MQTNRLNMTFSAISENEAFARSAVAAFVLPLAPTVEQLSDIKTAVSEAVTNSIVHGYPDCGGEITVSAELVEDVVHIKICDSGVGIEDVEQARMPFFTTRKGEERSGMGFTVMECVMDSVEVESEHGVTVTMTKRLG